MSNNHESKIIGVLRRGHFRCNDCIDFSDYDSVVRGVPGGARLECQYCGLRYAEAEAVEAEAETAEAVELQSECQTCGSEAIDHYYGKDEFYSGAYCAEHAPIAYETSTGRPIFHDTREGQLVLAFQGLHEAGEALGALHLACSAPTRTMARCRSRRASK